MYKNAGRTKTDKNKELGEKSATPIFIKYGLLAVAVIAALVIGILIYFNVAGGYVATVDGHKIKTGEFKYYLQVQKQNMYYSAYQEDQSISEETFWATPIGGEAAIDFAKRSALDTIQETKIHYIKAKEAKVSLTKDEIKRLDDDIQKSIIDKMDPDNNNAVGKGNKIRANKALLKQFGFSLEDLRKTQLESFTVQKYRSAEIAKITDAEADVETNYNKHPEWYKEDTQFRTGAEEAVWARHILLRLEEAATQADKDAAKKKAEDLIAELKGGADFATLAKENSEDPGSKDNGGEYLFGKGRMYPEFEEVAFTLNPGQITETPLLTSAGYHILKLEEKVAKDEPVSLNCAKNYNEYSGTAFVKYKIYAERVAGWLKEAKYKVEKNTAVYNSITN